MKISQALILITIQTICNCAKLPPHFKKCDVRKQDFNKCLGKAINDAVRQLYKPLHHYDFPSLGIFNRPEFRMELGDNSENGLQQVYKNITYYGLANPQATDANMDFENNTLKINVTYPEVQFDCDYEIRGIIVLLPVDATGRCHVFLATNSIPSLSCDFEHEDLCGWNHDLNHDFDWTRLNFATPSGSIGTGPSYDHTKGAGEDGYYMYIESSARNVNDTARLISPVFDKTYAPTCFEFWYHMHGSTTGSLRVYLKRVNEMWNLQPRNAIFIKSGNQGNRWYRGFIVLGVIDCEYQIVIEGVRGTSYVSDIAIDDVKIIQNCNPDDEIIERETTTEDFLSSETPIIVESCENRCNTNDSRTSDWLITCDCDEGCYERSRCCPDYFDFCVSGTTADVDATTDAEVTETTKTTMKIPTPPLITTWIPKRIKTTKITVKIPTPPLLTTWTPKRVNTAKIMVKIPTPPLLTTWTPKRVKTVPTTTIKTITKVIKISTKTQPKMTYSQSTESDYKDIPRTTVMEVETPGLPIEETEIITDYESDKNFDHQKIEVKNNVHENNTKTVVFAVGVVFGVLFAMVGTTFVARRYQLCRCHRIKLNQSANGDSQSDVRFLTGEEVLDFNLDY